MGSGARDMPILVVTETWSVDGSGENRGHGGHGVGQSSSPMLAGARDNRNGGRSGVRGCRGRIPLARGQQGRGVRTKATWWAVECLKGVSSRPRASAGRKLVGKLEGGGGKWPTSNRQASTSKILDAMRKWGINQSCDAGHPHRRQGPIVRAFQACVPGGATLTTNSNCIPQPNIVDARFPALWPLTHLAARIPQVVLVEKCFSHGFSALGSLPSNLAQKWRCHEVVAEKDRRQK